MAGAPVGNQNAAKAKRWQDALHKALARFETEDGKIKAGQALDKIAERVVEKALSGDKDSIAEIGNRLDGKPAQAITVAGDEDGGPIQHSLTVEFVNERGTEANDSVPAEA
jgi:hypothetical protein